MDTCILVTAGSTIFQVTLDVQANTIKLRSNLVMTASFQINFEQMIMIERGNMPVIQNGFFRSFAFFVVSMRLVLFFIFYQPVVQSSFFVVRKFINYRPEGLLQRFLILKHFIQTIERFAGTGK